jgi:probable phosphoglycerate mutase
VKIAPPGGGESLEQFDQRVQQGRRAILDQFEGQTVVVVAHVMSIRGFIRAAIDANWASYWRISVAPCSITVLRFWGDEAAEVSVINHTTHL